MSAYLVEHSSSAIHTVEDDLESSFYVVLWMSLMYKETYMDIIHRTKLIKQVFETDPRSSAKADWLIGRTNLPHDMFVDCKPLDNLIHTLAGFFSHWYIQISDNQQMVFDNFQLALEQSMTGLGGPVITEYMLKAAHAFMADSPVYQKEMGISHDTVIGIFNKYLDLSGWPVQDAAMLRKPQQEEKYGLALVTKSQSLFASGVEVTPSGKRHTRLDKLDADADDGDVLGSIVSPDVLVSLT